MLRTLRLERGRDLPIATGWAVAEPEFGDMGGLGMGVGVGCRFRLVKGFSELRDPTDLYCV